MWRLPSPVHPQIPPSRVKSESLLRIGLCLGPDVGSLASKILGFWKFYHLLGGDSYTGWVSTEEHLFGPARKIAALPFKSCGLGPVL